MEQLNSENQQGKPKKVGSDGLTKKERRALRTQDKPVEPHKVPTEKVSTKAQSKAQKKVVNNDKQADQSHLAVSVEKGPKVEANAVSKAELKAQRRAMQESQRLAKLTQEVKKEKSPEVPIKEEKKPTKKPAVKKHKVQLFNHLYFKHTSVDESEGVVFDPTGVHAAFLRLGTQYSTKTILGSNARCLALLGALTPLVEDFVTPPKQEMCRSLDSTLQTCIIYLQQCRPLAVSMTNALRHFKFHLTQIDTNLSDNEKKAKLLDCIETYIHDEINKAGEAISLQVDAKICNGDVILTYGCSSLIKKILLDSHRNGKQFQVIVVDSRPLREGKEMLRKLVNARIKCTYVLINAVSFIMNRASKVLLGAHALLANGYVMSRTGTAQVALIAHSYNKPVLVCCETYKFCERVQTDSFVYNEIGKEDKLIAVDTLEEESALANWRTSDYMTPLNIMYDVTPPNLVTAVVTELAILPCTSVPVVLRIRPTEVM